jgi:hypothetical protein
MVGGTLRAHILCSHRTRCIFWQLFCAADKDHQDRLKLAGEIPGPQRQPAFGDRGCLVQVGLATGLIGVQLICKDCTPLSFSCNVVAP